MQAGAEELEFGWVEDDEGWVRGIRGNLGRRLPERPMPELEPPASIAGISGGVIAARVLEISSRVFECGFLLFSWVHELFNLFIVFVFFLH